MSKTKIIRCLVVAHNALGEPDFYPCRVRLTQEEFDNDFHFRLASTVASAAAGFAEHGVVFDEQDGPEWLFERFNWEESTLVVVPSGEEEDEDTTTPTETR